MTPETNSVDIERCLIECLQRAIRGRKIDAPSLCYGVGDSVPLADVFHQNPLLAL